MSTQNPSIFAKLTKVDEAKRLIHARAVQETPDRADEIFDYESSKPHFEAWSKSVHEASGGKSFGNVRAMHGHSVAGVISEQLSYNDAEKAIDVVVHVVDDNDWKKVIAGAYTGLSIGGKYVGEKIAEKVDGKDLKRYTAKPHEVSLVDMPCIPTANFFEIIKADGVVEKREFDTVEKRIERLQTQRSELEHTATPESFAKAAELSVELADIFKSQAEAKAAAEAVVVEPADPTLTALIEKLLDIVKLESESVEKAGAKHSASTLANLQAMHDSLTKLVGTGMCGDASGMNDADKAALGDLTKRADDAQKLLDESGTTLTALQKLYDVDHALLKGLWESVGLPVGEEINATVLLVKIADIATERATLITKLTEAKAQIDEWKKRPADGKAMLRVVDKSVDYKPDTESKDPTVKPILKADGTVDEGVSLTKALLSGPPTVTRYAR